MNRVRLWRSMCRIAAVCGVLAVQPAAAAVSALVKVEPLVRHSISATVSGYGKVSAETASRVTISLPRAGRVTQLAVTDGALVHRGQTLFQFHTGAAASARYVQAAAAVRFAEKQLQHTSSLFAEKLATASQLDAAHQALADSEAALTAQRRMGSGLGVQRVTAPFSGVVLNVAVAQGDRIAAAAPILTLARAGQLRAQLGIDPQDVWKVAAGMPVTVRPVFGAAPPLHARVAAVHGVINPRTRLVDVVVALDGPEAGRLLPGMHVAGRITIASRRGWAVPRSAVLRDSRGAYLFQVDHGRAHQVYVTTGIENDRLVEVSGHFDTSLPVVVLGNYELKNGMAVRVGGQ